MPHCDFDVTLENADDSDKVNKALRKDKSRRGVMTCGDEMQQDANAARSAVGHGRFQIQSKSASRAEETVR